LKAALTVVKAEYERVQDELGKRSAIENQNESSTLHAAQIVRVIFGGSRNPVGWFEYTAKALVAAFIATGVCLTLDMPLLQTAPAGFITASYYIGGIRRRTQILSLILGGIVAGLAHAFIFEGLPTPHIVDLAKRMIVTRYPVPQERIIRERIPFEFSEKYYAAKFVVTSYKTESNKVNGVPGFETCVNFDLNEFEKALAGTHVLIIKNAGNRVCFPSNVAGVPIEMFDKINRAVTLDPKTCLPIGKIERFLNRFQPSNDLCP
jgi:hypothetical protein